MPIHMQATDNDQLKALLLLFNSDDIGELEKARAGLDVILQRILSKSWPDLNFEMENQELLELLVLVSTSVLTEAEVATYKENHQRLIRSITALFDQKNMERKQQALAREASQAVGSSLESNIYTLVRYAQSDNYQGILTWFAHQEVPFDPFYDVGNGKNLLYVLLSSDAFNTLAGELPNFDINPYEVLHQEDGECWSLYDYVLENENGWYAKSLSEDTKAYLDEGDAIKVQELIANAEILDLPIDDAEIKNTTLDAFLFRTLTTHALAKNIAILPVHSSHQDIERDFLNGLIKGTAELMIHDTFDGDEGFHMLAVNNLRAILIPLQFANHYTLLHLVVNADGDITAAHYYEPLPKSDSVDSAYESLVLPKLERALGDDLLIARIFMEQSVDEAGVAADNYCADYIYAVMAGIIHGGKSPEDFMCCFLEEQEVIKARALMVEQLGFACFSELGMATDTDDEARAAFDRVCAAAPNNVESYFPCLKCHEGVKMRLEAQQVQSAVLILRKLEEGGALAPEVIEEQNKKAPQLKRLADSISDDEEQPSKRQATLEERVPVVDAPVSGYTFGG